MLKAGIIGAGYIGEAHARGYAAVPGAELCVVCDRSLARAQKLAAPYRAQAVDTLEALIASGVHMVSVCTPTPTPEALATALLRAGVHVLCEKPIARTPQAAQTMIDTAAQSRAKLMVAFVSRFEAEHLKAKQIVARGDLGNLRMAYHAITGPYPDWSVGDWLGDTTQSGGPVVDLAIHSVDYLQWLFAQPVRRVYALGNASEHYVLLSLAFEGGGLGLVEASWAHPTGAPLTCRVELAGDRGRLAWDYDKIAPLRSYTPATGREDFVLEGENSFAAQIAAFVHCIEHDLPVPIPGEAGKRALQVCLAALESLRSGLSVELPSWDTAEPSGSDDPARCT